jgi:cell fate regulator YaaT (PSP1 superfamily)
MEENEINVVGVCYKKYGKKYYFNARNLNLKKNLTVIVETERGLQFGTVVTDIIKMDPKKINFQLKPVIRISTKKDYTNHLNNVRDAKKAFQKCNELIKKYELDMKLVEVNYTFERTQLFFTFISSDRVDFRELAKELAKIYKVRIELRQIGPRDKAKEVGGIGPCGRPMCCSNHLYSFNNITINMAKNQNIALNPSKINGSCNRLLCCLSYEDDVYTELKKDMPKIGDIIKKDDKEGKVISVDPLGKKYTIETNEKERIELVYGSSE